MIPPLAGLLDENLPAKIKYDFGEEYQVSTVREMGWNGKKNGELLGLAVFEGFEIFITLDKSLENQQNLKKVDLRVIVILAKDNKHQTLKPYISKLESLLKSKTIPDFSTISLD